MQIMTAKTTTLRTLYVQVVLNGAIFPQIFYDCCSICLTLSTCQVFTQVLLLGINLSSLWEIFPS